MNLDSQMELEITEWNLNSHNYSDPWALRVASHRIEMATAIAIISAVALAIGTINHSNTVTSDILGMDRFVTYDKLATASTAIRNGAAFIATNPDVNLPTENGMMPGAGSLTAFLKISTQREPLIIGKPFGYIMDGALERIGLTKEEIVMVGDNYNTDILAGMNYGVDTILALTGVTTAEDLEEVINKPTHILNDLSEWRFE